MEVTGSELARVSKKSRQYISKLFKEDQLVRNKNKKFSLEDPINIGWIKSIGLSLSDFGFSGVLPAAEKKPQKKSKKKIITADNNKLKSKQKEIKNKNTSNLTPIEFEEMINLPGELKDLTLEKLVLQFGNLPGIKSWAETLDKIMSGMKKSVEIQKIKHDLIERSFFQSHVEAYLNVLSEQLFDYAGTDKKMLKDFSKMIQHTQRNIDRELSKLQKIQGIAIANN